MRAVGPRIKVAYVVPPSQHFAGVERVVHEIASGLAEKYGDEIDTHVVYAREYNEEILLSTRYTPHVLGVRRLRSLVAAIRSSVAEHRFDVLVCPQVEASVLTWLATRGLGLPVFLAHLHGNPSVEMSRGSLSTRAAFGLFRRFVARRISGVLVVSPSLQRYAARSLARGVPVVFVPNPVREFESPEHVPSADGTFHFVTVARLSHQKGQDLLLRAVALARRELPRFRLTLVGSGPDESELRALSSSLGLDDVVVFAGYTTDPARYLRAADCFVLPSRWEGFGVALVEALRFGLPLLATDCQFGPADVITDADVGELVEPDSPEALAAGLVRAAGRRSDPAHVAARRAVADQYTRSAVIAEHAAVVRRFASMYQQMTVGSRVEPQVG